MREMKLTDKEVAISRTHQEPASSGRYAVSCGGSFVKSVDFYDVRVTIDPAKAVRFETIEGAELMVRACMNRNGHNARIVELLA